jgi:hypothetical protein
MAKKREPLNKANSCENAFLFKSYGTRRRTRHGMAPASPRVMWHRAHLSMREGSGVTTCPTVPDPPPGVGRLWHHHMSRAPALPPGRRGLQCRHVSCGSRPTSQCGRAFPSPRVPWHQARPSAGEGSGVATSPTVPDPPPGARGL